MLFAHRHKILLGKGMTGLSFFFTLYRLLFVALGGGFVVLHSKLHIRVMSFTFSSAVCFN